jgi:DNA-binding transcriptional ArsR family regulator
MTTRLILTTEDLTRLRFAVSPLWNAVASVHGLCSPSGQPAQRWLQQLARARTRTSLPLCEALLATPGRVPAFLLPAPAAGEQRFDDEIEHLAATPPAVVSDEARLLLEAGANGPIPTFCEQPERALAALCDELSACWTAVLRPAWPRLCEIAEADVMHGARTLALGGPEALLGSLHPRIRFHDGALDIGGTSGGRRACGSLVLVPLALAAADVALAAGTAVGYAARGAAGLRDPPAIGDALGRMLGRQRAGILARLAVPRTGAGLADELGISRSAVSQHVAALRSLGLLERQRVGRHVFLRRSARGAALVRLLAGDHVASGSAGSALGVQRLRARALELDRLDGQVALEPARDLDDLRLARGRERDLVGGVEADELARAKLDLRAAPAQDR